MFTGSAAPYCSCHELVLVRGAVALVWHLSNMSMTWGPISSITQIHRFIYTYRQTYTHIQICIEAQTYTDTQTHTLPTYIDTPMHRHIYTQTHIHRQTYTHTHIDTLRHTEACILK